MAAPLREKPASVPFDAFLGELATRLIGAPTDAADRAMEAVLRDIGERYTVDCVVLSRREDSTDLSAESLIWERRAGRRGRQLTHEDLPWMAAQTAAKTPLICFGNLDELPVEAAADRTTLEAVGLQAVLGVPFVIDDELDGGLGLSACGEYRWTEKIKSEVSTLAALLGHLFWRTSNRSRRLRSESRYRAVVEDQTEFICRALPDGTATWANGSICRLLGESLDALVGGDLTSYMHRADGTAMLDGWAKMTPEHPNYKTENEVALDSGEIIWAEWTDRGIFDEMGTLVEVQSVGRDITERRRMEDALKSSEAKFRDLVESSTDLIWEAGRDLELRYSNERLEEMLGYPPWSLRQAVVEELMHPTDLKQLRQELPRLIAEKSGWRRRLHRFRHSDGSYRFLESTATPVLDERGEVSGFRGVDRDVSGEYHAAEEIRSSETVIQTLLDSINDVVFTLDGNTFVDCNPALLKMFGAGREMILGKRPWDISPEFQPDGQSSEAKGRALLNRARSGEAVRFDWVHTAMDGSPIYADISLTRVRLRDGMRVFAILRDTTELRLANERLVRSAEFQRHKAELMMSLTSLTEEGADAAINRALADIGELYDAARISLWWHSVEDEAYILTHRWLTDAAAPSPLDQTIPASQIHWVSKQLLIGRAVVVQDINDMPEEAGGFRPFLEQTQCDAFLAVPTIVEGVNFGACTFAAQKAHTWDDLAIGELEILTNTIATAMSRFKAAEEMARHAAFQARLAEISSSLLDIREERIEPAIAEALARVGVDYGLDQINVTWFEDRLPGLGAPYVWLRSDKLIPIARPEDLPWGFDRVCRGEIVRVDSPDALPVDADVDRKTLLRLGVTSALSLPLRVGDEVYGAATFSIGERRGWDDRTVQELQLIANALTNSAIRRWSIRELKQSERDLARSQQVAGVGSFKAIGTAADDGSLAIRSVSLSDQALKIFSLAQQPDSWTTLESRIHPGDRKRVVGAWRDAVGGGEGAKVRLEYRVLNPHGSIRHIQSRGAIDHVDRDGVATAFGTYKDITEWVEANRQLQTALAEIEKLKDQLQEENVYLRDEVRAAHGFDKIIGESRALRSILAAAEQVAPTDVTVLVTGETGTGKELVAQSIHDLSHRKDKPIVCVNCAALSVELIESELFGHEKGAFTGAQAQRKGRFELANGGTLFLDEIGEMSGELQAKLLRVVQDGTFERLGGSETLHCDVRLIAATNRELQRAVDEGEFRADLYYRINSFPIHIPPLRERKSDIPLLAEYLARKHAKKLGKDVQSISARTLRYLRGQSWPGNIRELESTIVRALISTTGPVLDYAMGPAEAEPSSWPASNHAASSLSDAQRVHILQILEEKNWVIEGENGAAVALGLAPSSLRSKMKRLDIVRPTE